MNEREKEYNMSVHKVKQKEYLIQFCSQNIRKTHIERGEREKGTRNSRTSGGTASRKLDPRFEKLNPILKFG